MILFPIRLNVCAYCGFDVARVVPVLDGFRGLCNPDLNGCGAETDHALTEVEAVALWNNSGFAAAALRVAEVRRRWDSPVSDGDLIRYGDLRPCPCGCKAPVSGWFGPPTTHYIHCPACGDWLQGDSEDAVTGQWNRAAAKIGRAA